ncbi:BRO1-domain-containing protein [Pholiota conissans]|uniref:BRO domain-containing protein 1 n=1 Tax=Pholiota conissans TaxID=109636 RepID=A0A9P5ZDR0_9AGAR|nr:BRO1-domain-containing protein [Pholiota conissans]
MAHQSPMISIPKKTTEEVDWTTPIRNLIAQSYGENPDNYTSEYVQLQRCRQDAIRGAGSDITARDLLYKYFGQLELLELRFSEIRVNFPWHDAFTNKLITQTSIAYEKASVLFQIAVTHSAIAASQSRSDPEGIKRAFYYFRTCAGMLTYINENFLHAPSTDLSREVVKFLINIILAQATEVFFEKCTDEKKSNALVSKIGSQAAYMYTSLSEEVKEFMGKGIFDRNWVTIIQIKAKYFSSLAQYYRGLADHASGKHGDALQRFIQAESLAKEASRSATSFASMFVSNMSPNLPVDAGNAIQERTKGHLVICTDKKNEAQRENDLIYNAIMPPFESLPVIEKTAVATPIHIHEVYAQPEVQKTIGQDFFIRLVPLSVHESASVYSEEKAKLVRGEVEKADAAEGEARSALDGLGVKEGLIRFKAMAEGEVTGDEEVPLDVRRWKEDIALVEDRDGVDGLMRALNNLKGNVHQDLDSISRDLDQESRECETMRVKYEHLWTQAPSSTLTKTLRQDLKSHLNALEAAGASDQQVSALWDSVRPDILLLLSPQVEQLFSERGGSKPDNLLELDVDSSEGADEKERNKIKGYVDEIEDRLKRLNLISKERAEVLKDLKDKIQSDDVSHLLLLNRRNSGVEPTLFAAELEKFKPYQQRLSATVQHQDIALQELTTLWKGLKDHAGRGAGARKWDEREKRKKDTVRRFSRARDGYMEVRDGLAKGLQFYTELTELTTTLRGHARSFISERRAEREALIGKLETEKRLSAATSPPPLAAKPPVPPPPQSRSSLDSAFSSMNLRDTPANSQQTWKSNSPAPTNQHYGSSSPYGSGQQQHQPQQQQQQQQQYQPSYASAPPPPQNQPSQYSYQQQPYGNQYASSPPPPQQPQQQSQQLSSNFFPPPPSRPPTHSSSYSIGGTVDPYASLGAFNPGQASAPSLPPPPPPPPSSTNQGGYYGQQQPQQQPPQQSQYGGLPPPPPPQQQQQQYYAYPPQGQQQGFPPPPPPPGQQPQYGGYQPSPLPAPSSYAPGGYSQQGYGR